MSRPFFVLGLITFAACEPALEIEAYCRELSQAQCSVQQRCGLLSPSVDCRVPQVSFDCLAPYRAALTAKTIRYDPANARRCVEDSRANSSCGVGPLFAPPSCQSVLVGDTKEGEPCGQCAEGLMCVRLNLTDCGTCAKSTYQPASLPKRGEACVSPLVDGPGCEVDSWCQEGVCVARVAVGEACGSTVCVTNATCVQGTCVARPELGEACGDFGCNTGLACVGGRCVQRVGVGAECASNAHCVSGLCLDGSCSVGRAAKSPCDDTAPCQPGLRCVNAKCEAFPGHGEACDGRCAWFDQCVDGVCVDYAQQVCR